MRESYYQKFKFKNKFKLSIFQKIINFDYLHLAIKKGHISRIKFQKKVEQIAYF
jgi:hypothetical protein